MIVTKNQNLKQIIFTKIQQKICKSNSFQPAKVNFINKYQFQKTNNNNLKKNNKQNNLNFQFCSQQNTNNTYTNQPFETNIYTDIQSQKQDNKRGTLTIVPTPIGNLKDLSIRQYDALLNADLIACEDTRITGNMLNLIRQKRISDSFKDTFDIDFEELQKKKYEQEENNNQQNKQNKQNNQEDDDFDEGENTLQLIENFQKNELMEIQENNQINRVSREERLLSKIIEIRQKARVLLQEQDSLDIYDEKKNQDGFEGEDISFYGLEDEFIRYLKAKIAHSKKYKGRGVLISYHKYNEELRIERLVKIMNYGLNIALVSDAGTPTISDPGYILVNRCIQENLKINSLPGSSAVLVALSSSGFPSDRFMFEGYLSRTQLEKEDKLERIKNLQITSVVFENLNRLPKTLLSIEKHFGQNQMIFIGFEMTKMFEKKYRGKVRDLYEELTDPEQTKYSHLKGEITIVIPPCTPEFNIDQQGVYETQKDIKQHLYNEWNNKQLTEEQVRQSEEILGYNKDYDYRQQMAQKMMSKLNTEGTNNKNKNEENDNHVFQINGKVLATYLNDNLDVSNKELASILTDILKISKTRSYNLVKTVREQNNQNRFWNNLLDKNIKK